MAKAPDWFDSMYAASSFPWRARTALSARTVRMLQPRLHLNWPDIPSEIAELCEAILMAAEAFAAGGDLPDMDLSSRLSTLTADVDARMPRLERPQEAIVVMLRCIDLAKSIEHDQGTYGAKPVGAVNLCSWPLDWLKGSRRSRTQSLHQQTYLRDFMLLEAAINEGAWTDDTPVAASFFGPLWPLGRPLWLTEKWPPIAIYPLPEALSQPPSRAIDIPEAPRCDVETLSHTLGAEYQSLLNHEDVAFLCRNTAGGRTRFAVPVRHQWRAPAPSALLSKVRNSAPPSPGRDQLLEFYTAHDGGCLFLGKGESDDDAPLELFSLSQLNARREGLLSYFDLPFDDDEDDRLPGAWAYKGRSLVVLAGAESCADCYFMAMEGRAKGKVYFFDHELGFPERAFAPDFVTFLTRMFKRLPGTLPEGAVFTAAQADTSDLAPDAELEAVSFQRR